MQRHVDAVLALMGLQIVPDVTTTSLSMHATAGHNPTLTLSQLGAGFTVSDSFPLYLEGLLSYSRYDPSFVASNGQESERIVVRWNSLAASVGIGWDFSLNEDLTLRPIANLALGYVASDAKLLTIILSERLGRDLDFLRGGSVDAFGYGGSPILDYEHYREAYEIDVELRGTFMRLESFGGSDAVHGSVDVPNLNLWARWRAPIGDWSLFKHPVRR